MGPKVVACNMRSSYVKVMPQKENTGGGGGDITVDSELSLSSENPVQNKIITGALNGKADIFIVNFAYNEETYKLRSDKSFAEIISAIDSGKTVIGLDDVDGKKIPMYVNRINYPIDMLTFSCVSPKYDTGSYNINQILLGIYSLDANNQNDVATSNITIWTRT